MSFIFRSFGGLGSAVYLRHFVYSLLLIYLPQLYMELVRHPNESPTWQDKLIPFIFFVTVCQCLYPYSRFVYESITNAIRNFFSGESDDYIFIFPAIFLFIPLLWKYVTMAFCFALSHILAPFGLIWLGRHNG